MYPFFLVAGISLLIPLLLHLFNLRKYTRVLFSANRFLQSMTLQSNKMAVIRKKKLLLFRLLALAFLILAFAKPILNRDNNNSTNNLIAIYIDNSPSLLAKQGVRSLFDKEIDAALQLIMQSKEDAQFLILSNEGALSYEPVAKSTAKALLQKINIGFHAPAFQKSLEQIQEIRNTALLKHCQFYYFSDFQKSMLLPSKDTALYEHIDFVGIAVQTKTLSNARIDTAFLATTSNASAEANQLIIASSISPSGAAQTRTVKVLLNQQLKTVKEIKFNEKGNSIDTIALAFNLASWQKITLILDDRELHFDDTFRLACKKTDQIPIGFIPTQASPYIEAGLNAYSGFTWQKISPSFDLFNKQLCIIEDNGSLQQQDWTSVDSFIKTGKNVVLFLGDQLTKSAAVISYLEQKGIHIIEKDTQVQTIGAINTNQKNIAALFEKIPENIQLPQLKWHYKITSDIVANPNNWLVCKNGDPYLSSYQWGSGNLFIISSDASLRSNNFVTSYLFVPLLYTMAAEGQIPKNLVHFAASQEPVWLPNNGIKEEQLLHLKDAFGMDVIPIQKNKGNQLAVFTGKHTQQTGFYSLANAQNNWVLSINAPMAESNLDLWKQNELDKALPFQKKTWLAESKQNFANPLLANNNFSLWKLCIILALLFLLLESWIIVDKKIKKAPTL